MPQSRQFVVTGALGYSGKAIAERLFARGDRVRTLTNSPRRPNPFGDRLEIRPLAFEDHAGLVESLRGADVLINTYWVRFNHRLFTFEQGVANTKRLFRAAREAGVGRIVHVSVLCAEGNDDLGYYKGKAELERDLKGLGVAYSIVRPGVLFGRGDILVNNIAWTLRRLPLFGVFGDGMYELEPMHVDDFAALAVRESDAGENRTVDAKGPERFAYRDLVRVIGGIIGEERRIVSVPLWAGLCVTRMIDPFVGDRIITREEALALMRGLLATEAEPTGATRLTEWARAHREELGRRYASEVGRRVKREVAYEMV